MRTSGHYLKWGGSVSYWPLVKAAWLEYRVNAGYRGGTGCFAECRRSRCWVDYEEWRVTASPHGLAPSPPEDRRQADLEETRPPGWFVREELGFAFEHGPSLMWTVQTVAKTNLQRMKIAGAERPYRLSFPPTLLQPAARPRRENKAPRGRRGGRGGTL